MSKKRETSGIVAKINGFDVLIYAVLILFGLITLYPFVFTLAGSFNDAMDYDYGGVWLFPREFTFASYEVVFTDSRIYGAFFITTAITVIGTVTGLLFTSCVAYALSRRSLRGSKFFWIINMIPMFISGGMIPMYMLIQFSGLYNTFMVYILPGLYSVFNMIILCNFFRGIDEGLYESAKIDGAGEFRIWFSIYMPVSKPALVTVALWIAVGRWNTYMPTLLWTDISSSRLWTLQFYLMRLIREKDLSTMDGNYWGKVSAQTLSFAAIVVSMIPVVLAYPFMSKHLAKGITLGSMKG